MAEAPLEHHAPYYQMNTVLLQRFTSGFTEADWTYTPGPCNHAFWLVGHLALCRRAIRRALGDAVAEADWENQFQRGGQCDIAPDRLPPADLVQDFIESGEAILKQLPHVTAEQAGRETGREFPTGDSTLAGLVRFMHFHESYHLGQIALLARLRGKDTIG